MGFALQVNVIKMKCSGMFATIVNSCFGAAYLPHYLPLFTTFLVRVKYDENVQFFFSLALGCKNRVNAVFTIFASRANIIQQWNLLQGK